jgi:hypothetical protein
LGIDHFRESEGVRFNADLRGFTEDDWRLLVRDMHGIGIDTLVLQNCTLSAPDGSGAVRAYYRSKRYPRFDWIRGDTFGAVVAEATACGMTLIYGIADMFGPDPYLRTRDALDYAKSVAGEILELYGSLPSFGGWYWTKEYSPSTLPGRDSLRIIVPELRAFHDCDIMIAPNADGGISPTLLADIDVDIIAYQDTVGLCACPDQHARGLRANRHHTLDRLPFLYEQLRYFHNAWQPQNSPSPGYWNYYTRSRGRTALWNDLEVWEFDHRRELLSAETARVISQLDLTAPYVDKQIIFQYPGLMHNPDHPIPLGGERARTLYEGYYIYRQDLLAGKLADRFWYLN